ncbi:MAG: AAA family ATPase [Candidatus Thorarchaeota archaeon]|nr:MAG: AAA family ATPase [Candidatus Thorarchaeota archaeon]
MKLVIITGMPGAGKSEVASAYQNVGKPVIVMGDSVRDEVQRQGLQANPENTRQVMLELRNQKGPGAIAKLCLQELSEKDSDIVVIEGCRSIDEIDVFDDYASQLTIVCIHSSPSTRFARLRKRARDDAPPDWSTFRERDLREISVGLGGVIALADKMIVNEGSIEELRRISTELAEAQ